MNYYTGKSLVGLYGEYKLSILYCLLGIFVGYAVHSAYLMYISKPKANQDDYLRKAIEDRASDKIPKHIAVIMDGNRRYGRKKMSDPLQGHWAGGQTLVDFVQWCMADGVEILTVYAFSTENWERDPLEVSTLMSIFAKYAESFQQEALARNVRVRVLSTDFHRLPMNVRASVEELERSTSRCTGFRLNVCLSYGSRAEFVNICQSVAQDVSSGALNPQDINEAFVASRLLTAGIPDPDILIRTSGEMRISNFLLWQIAYTELFFIPKFWPEVTQTDLRLVLHEYCERQRRFGS